jgi:Domain of unknown function DUF488
LKPSASPARLRTVAVPDRRGENPASSSRPKLAVHLARQNRIRLLALSNDFPPGTGVRLWTLGHAHHRFEEVLKLLRSHEIELVVDVRSRPWVKWAGHFNREELEPALVRGGLEYAWRGDTLGGIPEGDRFYDEAGYTLYEPLVQEQWFMKGIAWVEYQAERCRLALICLEDEPERCHRHVLLARVLTERGAEVINVRGNGSIESYRDVELRLGRGQASLFEPIGVWRSPAPMRRN